MNIQSFQDLFCIFKHEIMTTLRHAHSWLTGLLFFVMVICLFPFAVGPDSVLLQQISASIIWIAVMLATLLSIANLFTHDSVDGHLDMLLQSSYPLSLIVLCKIASHWVMNCLPFIVICPLIGFLLRLNAESLYTLIGTLLLGTPALSLLGAIGAGLIEGKQGSGLLLPVLIIPLYLPTLIFGIGAMTAASQHLSVNGYFAILTAISLFSLCIGPFFTAFALRIGVN